MTGKDTTRRYNILLCHVTSVLDTVSLEYHIPHNAPYARSEVALSLYFCIVRKKLERCISLRCKYRKYLQVNTESPFSLEYSAFCSILIVSLPATGWISRLL